MRTLLFVPVDVKVGFKMLQALTNLKWLCRIGSSLNTAWHKNLPLLFNQSGLPFEQCLFSRQNTELIETSTNTNESAPNHSGNALSNRLSSLLPTWRLLFRHVSTREESIFEFPPFGNLRSSSAAKMSAASTPSSDVSSIHSWYLLGLDTIWRLFQSIFP